jgi:hypothetical protein
VHDVPLYSPDEWLNVPKESPKRFYTKIRKHFCGIDHRTEKGMALPGLEVEYICPPLFPRFPGNVLMVKEEHPFHLLPHPCSDVSST